VLLLLVTSFFTIYLIEIARLHVHDPSL
jgi:hypothetical protein